MRRTQDKLSLHPVYFLRTTRIRNSSLLYWAIVRRAIGVVGLDHLIDILFVWYAD